MKKYPSINGLRALSIFLVIICHISGQYGVFQQLSNLKWLDPFIFFITDGHFGVNVFFVISGFLITSLLVKEEQNNGLISLKNFYLRRTLRIFPAYYFLLFVYFVIQKLGYIEISSISWLTAITYTKYFNWQEDWYTAHSWSLSIEEHFYLFWPVLFIAGDTVRKRASIVLIIIVPILRFYLHFFPISWINGLTIFVRIDSIALGCFFALYQDRIIQILSPYWKPLFYLSILSIFLIRYVPGPLLGSTQGSIANIAIAIIMMYSVFGPKGLWFKFLNLRVLNYIGMLSYSLYLWQQFFINKSSLLVNQFPLSILLVFGCAVFSYYVIEKPFLNLKDKLSSKATATITPYQGEEQEVEDVKVQEMNKIG